VLLPPQTFSSASGASGAWFPNDLWGGMRSFDDFLFKFDYKKKSDGAPSLVFGPLEEMVALRQIAHARTAEQRQYPLGLPTSFNNWLIYFRLEDLFNGVMAALKNLSSPTFAYFHLFPPHEPYRPSADYYLKFVDRYTPTPKPNHPLVRPVLPTTLISDRRKYDEYIASVDAQFGRLLDNLEHTGILQNSLVVVTADHGQLFERGVAGHSTPLMYDPVLHIPLLVSMPGQTTRVDIHDPTNSVDVLPTLLHLTGQSAPAWAEGTLLPGLGGTYDPGRSTFSVEAKNNSAFRRLTTATIAMRKGPYKLLHYMNYRKGYDDAYELYDLENDLDELHDLYLTETALAAGLRSELLAALDKSNSQFPA
jgi:arylsulfatase A-like enzyme